MELGELEVGFFYEGTLACRLDVEFRSHFWNCSCLKVDLIEWMVGTFGLSVDSKPYWWQET